MYVQSEEEKDLAAVLNSLNSAGEGASQVKCCVGTEGVWGQRGEKHGRKAGTRDGGTDRTNRQRESVWLGIASRSQALS